MLDELRRITSTEPYKSYGCMRVKEILIKPWETPDAKFTFELWVDDYETTAPEIWEISCNNLMQIDGIPQFISPTTQIELIDDHPLLWNCDEEIFFSIASKTNDITALMGELFIEHTKACGNWVDFHRQYSGLPDTLATLRENQFAIPARLKSACFNVLDKYGVEYRINEVQNGQVGYQVLFFSRADIWPNKENYGQSYIIAENFLERRIS